MNERIRELAEQATKHYPATETSGEFSTFNKEKFAELIVRECAEQIKLKGTDWIDWMPSQLGIRPEYVDMAQHIKQHFGVEK